MVFNESFKKIKEKIPLYVNNLLPEPEKKKLEELFKKYPELNKEVKEFQIIKSKIFQYNKKNIPDKNVLFNKILKKIEEESFLNKIKEFFTIPYIPWGLVAAQIFIIIFLFYKAQKPQNNYKTLTFQNGNNLLNVVFNPNIKEEEIRNLLLKINGIIIFGPDKRGLYIVKIKNSKNINKIIKLLQKSKKIKFVQKKM